MRDELQEELTLFRETVVRFIENEIAPHYEQWGKGQISAQVSLAQNGRRRSTMLRPARNIRWIWC